MNNKTQINVNQKIEATSTNKFIKMLSSIENNKESRKFKGQKGVHSITYLTEATSINKYVEMLAS